MKKYINTAAAIVNTLVCMGSVNVNSVRAENFPYTESISHRDGITLITIRQTPSWADLTLEDRKALRENMWRNIADDYSGGSVTVEFYTSHGYNIAEYSTACGGRCFTRE